MRPFNVDEISGFISWLLVGHVIWIVVGTTTFFSLALLAINTIFAQETLARFVGNYLTKSTGCQVVFESAIVPKWGDGVITFRNVFVSRRPGQGKANVSKGSQEIAAAAAAAAAKANDRPDSILMDPDEDTNYTQFDLSIDEVNVTLSFAKWFNSRGILQDVEVRGVRGVIDRTNVRGNGEVIDPKSLRYEHNPGDFEIESFKLKDLLVTLHQPSGFRPFPISVYEADLPRLRKQWLFYDFMSANSMSGEFDGSLFTIHPRQTHSITGTYLGQNGDEKEPFKKQSRIRIDSLNIDHLNRGVEGPFSWIHEGNVDIVADIMFPADTHESLPKIIADFYDRLEATVTSSRHNAPYRASSGEVDDESTSNDRRFLIMDLRVHLNDVRASVPIFTRDLSYVNNAFIRPIVAYINSRRTFIPIQCRVVKRASDFDGSWTIFDSGLMDDLSAEVSPSLFPYLFIDSEPRSLVTRIVNDGMIIDLRRVRSRRYGRPSTDATLQKGWALELAVGRSGHFHGHGWKSGLIRYKAAFPLGSPLTKACSKQNIGRGNVKRGTGDRCWCNDHDIHVAVQLCRC